MVTEAEKTITDVKPNWQPQWLVKDKHGCECGITIDDHCYVVLCRDWEGNWKPSKHIPITVAEFLGKLVNEHN